MPNAFVIPGTPAVNLPLIDPAELRAARTHFRPDAPPELAYANSLYVPTGRWPSRGWILLRRGDYNRIANLYRTDFQLQIDDFVNGGLTFKNLAVVQAQCVTRGVAADPNAVYLVELTDPQGVLWSPWFQFPTTSQYNVVSPAYPGQYYSASTNGGVPWTWSGMVGDLWNQCGTFLGPYPGLPVIPSGTPQDFSFPGVSAWDALNRVLELLGLTTSESLLLASPYGIVQIGAADAAFTANQTKYAGLLEEDYEYLDSGAGRIPGSVVNYFHRRNEFYGTEETVRGDSLQWQTTPLYQVTIPAPAQFASAPGVGYLWNEFTVRFDIDGNVLAVDAAQAQAIATERTTQLYNRLYRGTAGYLRQVYAGALPFAAGSLLDGVAWRRQGHGGWRTELIRGPQPPWPQVVGAGPQPR